MDAASFSENTEVDLQPSRKLRPKKILVVEDDKNMTVLLGKALLATTSDAEISWAVSLEQAFTQIIQNTDINQKTPYDLVIADIFLEGAGTGLDFLKVINHTFPKIPFLVISSLSHDEVKKAVAREAKENLTYLQKPFQFGQCTEQIKTMLKEL